jgi:hypothetical protein
VAKEGTMLLFDRLIEIGRCYGIEINVKKLTLRVLMLYIWNAYS